MQQGAWRARVQVFLAFIYTVSISNLASAASPMTTPGEFRVNETGAATYTIPIQVPPGTAGMEPKLSLVYNSQAGNGLMGMGWSLSGLSAITRCPRTVAQDGVRGAVNYDWNDRYCLDGQRLVAISGAYGVNLTEYRTERESFSKVVSYGTAGNGPAYFIVKTKSGLTMWYGLTADSRIEAQGKATVRVWAINRIQDVKGNYLTVAYTEDSQNGDFYPSQIDYTVNDNQGLVPNNSVRFEYSPRAAVDTVPLYHAGSIVKTTVRLDFLRTFHDAALVTEYRLAYGAGDSTGRLELTKLTECGADGQCLLPSTMTWQQDPVPSEGNFNGDGTGMWTGHWGTQDNNFIGDFNGDGKSDMAGYTFNGGQWHVCLSTGTGFDCSYWTGHGGGPTNNVLGDFNGDGRTDMAGYMGTGNQWHVCLSTGAGFNCSIWIGHGGGPTNNALGDFDGDGRADIAAYMGTGNQWHVCLSTGNGFNCTIWIGHGGGPTNNALGDFNGDGKTDMAGYMGTDNQWHVCLSTGNGFNCTIWIGHGGGPTNNALGDFNGDGKTDMAGYKGSGQWHVCLSTGAAFNCSDWLGHSGGAIDNFVGDYNGDGKADMAAYRTDLVGQWMVCLSTGSGFNCGGEWDGHGGGYEDNYLGDYNGDGKTDMAASTGVLGQWQVTTSGGRRPDVVEEIDAGTGASIRVSYRTLPQIFGQGYLRETDPQYPLVAPTLPLAVVTDAFAGNGISGELHSTYKYGTLRADFRGRGIQGFQWVEATHLDTTVTTRTEFLQDWPYTGLPSLVRKTVPNGGNAGLLSQVSNTYACEDFDANPDCQVLAGKRYFPTLSQSVEQSWDLDGAFLGNVLTATTYDCAGSPTTCFGNAAQITVSSRNEAGVPDGYSKTTDNTYTNDDTNWRLGRLTRASVTSAMPGRSQTRTSAFDYGAGLLSKEIVEPTNSDLCVVTGYTYDAFGNKTTATTRNCNGTAGSQSGVNSEAAAPAAGSLAIIATRISSNTYDARGQFPLISANALGQSETRTYDERFGTVATLKGPNELTTGWQYDSFGRKVLETRPDGNQTKWVYKLCSSVSGGCEANGNGVVTPVYYIQSTPLATDGVTANGPWTTVYFDALNREIRTEAEGYNGSAAVVNVTLTRYDALGRVSEKSRPFGSGHEADAKFVSFEYDLLGRVKRQVEPDTANPEGNQTLFAYNGRSSTVTNAKGQTQTKIQNSQGQVIAVRTNASAADGTDTTLTYTYDPFGNLESTTDALGNVTDLDYDLRGRKTSMSDPDMGNWTYEYSALGELVRQTDAKGQVTTMGYDKLGRVTTRRDVADGRTSNWYFDTYKGGLACDKGKGKLCEAEVLLDGNPPATIHRRKHAYDAFGRAASTATTIDDLAVPYTASTIYDVNGRVATQTWPTGFSVYYIYTAHGFLKAVRRNDSSNALYWRADEYDPEGRLTKQIYGNNVATTLTYNAATGRLDGIVAGAGNAVQNLAYGYDSLGNLKTRVDAVAGVSESFDYDALNRLVASTAQGGGIPGAQSAAYGYDSIGNLTCKGEIGACSAASPNLAYGATVTVNGQTRTLPHAVRSVTGRVNGVDNPTYTYDANGNLTDGAGRSVTSYQSFNLPKEIVANGKKLQYVYDAERQRILERLCGATSNCDPPDRSTVYLHPANGAGLFYEKETAGATVKHRHFISAGGVTIAVVTQTGTTFATTYWHRDHLGSTVAVTNSAGVICERLGYEPFGKRRFANGPNDPGNTVVGGCTDRGFTGHEHLDEVGLIHMNGRIYDPALGRFMTADAYIQDPLNLQGYNRYSYVNNNPLAFTDPSGHLKLGRLLVAIAVAWFLGPEGFPLISEAAAGGTAAAALANSLIAGAAAGGVASGNLQGALQGAFTAGLFYGAGSLASELAGIEGIGGAEVWGEAGIGRAALHAAAGCLGTAASGGGCRSGALSAGFAQFAGGNLKLSGFTANLVIRTVIGGTASVIGGGKFANGAVTAAFGYLFNQLAHPRVEVFTFEPTGWGGSSFGHSAIAIDQVVYSFGPDGMTIEQREAFMARNSFRSAVGQELEISSSGVTAMRDLLANFEESYSVMKFQTCVQPVVYALGVAGVSVGTPIFPVSLGNALIDTGKVVRTNMYPQTTPRVRPWYYPSESAPWAR